MKKLTLYNNKVAPNLRNNVNGKLFGRGTSAAPLNVTRVANNCSQASWMSNLRSGPTSFVSAPLIKATV